MTLEALMSIIPIPKKPYEPGKGRNWKEVEISLGTPLPSDYIEFIDRYGTGLVSNHIWVYNPFSTFDDVNLLIQVPRLLDIWMETKADFGAVAYPYPLYPEQDGLLPWGHIDTGSELCWQTSGNPEHWTVVVNESRGLGFQAFEEPMTSFLVSLFSGRVSSEILPKTLQRRRTRVSFTPLQKLLAQSN